MYYKWPFNSVYTTIVVNLQLAKSPELDDDGNESSWHHPIVQILSSQLESEIQYKSISECMVLQWCAFNSERNWNLESESAQVHNSLHRRRFCFKVNSTPITELEETILELLHCSGVCIMSRHCKRRGKIRYTLRQSTESYSSQANEALHRWPTVVITKLRAYSRWFKTRGL